MPMSTQNASLHVLTNASNTSEDTKCLSECHDQTLALPAVTQNASHVLSKRIPWKGSTQNISEHAFIKSLLCQRGHKMHPNMC